MGSASAQEASAETLARAIERTQEPFFALRRQRTTFYRANLFWRKCEVLTPYGCWRFEGAEKQGSAGEKSNAGPWRLVCLRTFAGFVDHPRRASEINLAQGKSGIPRTAAGSGSQSARAFRAKTGKLKSISLVLRHGPGFNGGVSIIMEAPMAEELSHEGKAAAGYDGAFAQVTTHFAPFLLRAAHIKPGMRVLDIATGTGLAGRSGP